MFCGTCGQAIPEGAAVCPSCGAPVEQETEPVAAEELFTQQGEERTASPAADGAVFSPFEPGEPTGSGEPPKPPKAGKKLDLAGLDRKKLLLIAGIAAGVILLLILLFAVILPALNGGSGESYVYINDDNEVIYMRDLGAKTQGVTVYECRSSAGAFFSEDDSVLYIKDGDTLRYIETATIGREEPKRLDSGVNNIKVLKKGGLVYTDGRSNLMYFDGGETHKLAKGIGGDPRVSRDENYAYYTDGEGRLYRARLQADGEEEKLASNVFELIIPAEGVQNELVLFSRYDNGLYDLYTVRPGDRPERAASDVESTCNVRQDGSKLTFNYITYEQEEGWSVYTIWRWENGESTEVVSEAAELYQNWNTLLYRKWEDIDSDDYYASVAESPLYYYWDGAEHRVELEGDFLVNSAHTVWDEWLVLQCSDGDDQLLLGYAIEKGDMTGGEILAEGEVNVRAVYEGLYYTSDYNSDRDVADFYEYKDGENRLIAGEVKRVLLTEDKTYAWDEDDLFCQVDGEDWVEIGEEATDVNAIAGGQLLYISDGDLYHWNGKESRRVDTDVVDVVAGERSGDWMSRLSC